VTQCVVVQIKQCFIKVC